LKCVKNYQDLPTRGAADVKQFSINGSLFLAFANYRGNGGIFKRGSFIYKLNDLTGTFALYQTIVTTGVRHMEYFRIGEKHYLAVANYRNMSTYQLNSVIYQWNGHQFVAVQSIPTNGATSLNFFKNITESISRCYECVCQHIHLQMERQSVRKVSGDRHQSSYGKHNCCNKQ